MKVRNNQKKGRKSYSINQKIEVIKFKESKKGLLCSQRDLSAKFNMPVGVINKILKDKVEIEKSVEFKDARKVYNNFSTLRIDCLVYEWFVKKRQKNFIISGDMIKTMALRIASRIGKDTFKASNGWMECFKNRHNISSKAISGEEGLVDQAFVENFKDLFERKIAEYEPKNIFNCDETGLFFKCGNPRTYVVKEQEKASGKFSKERITVLLCASSRGEKLDLLMIGKYKNPRGFKNIDFNKLNIKYVSSQKSWMSAKIFTDWLTSMNDQFLQQNRKVLLLLDNAPVHLNDIALLNIELLFLPKNTTSLLQPCDQGIIRSFKAKYRSNFNADIALRSEDSDIEYVDLIKDYNLAKTIPLISHAWQSVGSDVIKNCFEKAFSRLKFNECMESSNEKEFEEFPAYDPNDYDDEEFIETIKNTGEKDEFAQSDSCSSESSEQKN